MTVGKGMMKGEVKGEVKGGDQQQHKLKSFVDAMMIIRLWVGGMKCSSS